MKLVGYNSQMETTIDSLRSTAFLLVGFFARARASVLAIVVASATAVGLAACGGGGGGDPQTTGRPTAYFHGAARVEGLQYRYEDGGSGETDARGGFQFEQGKTVVFSVGITPLGTVEFSSDERRDFVTPLRIVDGDQAARETQAVRVERLLIALDDDNNVDNGIKIPAAALTSAINLLTIAELQMQMPGRSNDVDVDGLTLNIPSTTLARQELAETNNCAYSGVFAGSLSDDGDAVAVALMPNIGELTVTDVVDLSNASPAISFTRDGEGNVVVGEAFLTINLKIPPLVTTLELEGEAIGTMTLASYDRIEFGGGTVFGTVRRVAGNPNADYRLAGVYGDNDGDGAFVADIYNGGNAEIFYINDPNAQNLLPAGWSGEFPTAGGRFILEERGSNNSLTLTLSAAPTNIFKGVSDKIGGSWCEL